MKKTARNITAFALLSITALLVSCSHLYFSKTVLENVRGGKIFSFVDNGRVITLRTNSCGFDYFDRAQVNLSYQIYVPSSLSENASCVYLRLTDAQGFEIREVRIGDVVKSYSGSLKGTVEIDPSNYERIAGAEIVLRSTL